MIDTTNLLDKQIPHVKRLIDSLHLNGFAADLSETGCGKTYCASVTAREVNVPIFIICPKIVIPSWKAVLKEVGIKPLAIRNYESLIRGNKNSFYTSWVKEDHPTKKDTKGNPVKMDRLRFNKRLPDNALVIYDEAHKCKALDSSNSELLVTAREQGFKTLLLSASAATNPIEMKAFGFVTHLHGYREQNDFKRNFAAHHGAEWTGRFGTMTFDPESEEARKSMKAIHNYLFKTVKCASRLTRKIMKAHFGNSHVMADALDMKSNTTKINKVYEIMEYELAQLDERAGNYSSHIFAIMMEARRRAELLKIPTYVETALNSLREGNSIAVFLNFNESIDSMNKLLQKKLSTKAGKEEYGDIGISFIRGGQTDLARERDIAAFQADENRIIIANIVAGGVGVSLHDLNGQHPRHSIISPNYSAVQLLQALGRSDRAQAKTDSLQQIIYAAETIEEQACRRVQARLNNLSLLNDGDMTSGIKFYGPVDFDIHNTPQAA